MILKGRFLLQRRGAPFFVQGTIKKQIHMKENTIYHPPQVEVIEVQVEQGFATSYGTNGIGEDEGAW